MSALPSVTPSFAPQPNDVPWPTRSWPRGTASNDPVLKHVVDQAFVDPALHETLAVLVVKDGRLLLERYAGNEEFFDREPVPVTPDTRLISWSMAKSMLHFLVGTLVDEGRLDPTRRAGVPEWSDPSDPRHAITLADLLAMRDGLDFIEDYVPGGVSHVIEMLFGEGQADVAGYTAQRPLAHTPGTVFNYSSGTTNVISRIVADVVGYGAAYESFLRERLFGPLGMTSATARFDETGVFIASSYVDATAQDFARFGTLYLRGGAWDGEQLVSSAWVDTAQVPRSQDAESGNYYSWQWWVTGDEHGSYWANGYQGQMIVVVPALNAVIVRLGRTDASHYPELRAWRDQVIATLANATVAS